MNKTVGISLVLGFGMMVWCSIIKENGLGGLMLETQDINVSACQF